MVSLKDYVFERMIVESVNNFFENDKDKKHKYKDQVYSILQKAYASQGGLVGSGFGSPDDMVNNIPFWKLDIVNGEVLAVVMYKFSENRSGVPLRKTVGMGALYDKDRKDFIRNKLINLIKNDAERSIFEISGKAEKFNRELLGSNFNKYVFTVDQVKEILKKDDIIAVDKYRFKRKIGGEYKEKIMLGTATPKR